MQFWVLNNKASVCSIGWGKYIYSGLTWVFLINKRTWSFYSCPNPPFLQLSTIIKWNIIHLLLTFFFFSFLFHQIYTLFSSLVLYILFVFAWREKRENNIYIFYFNYLFFNIIKLFIMNSSVKQFLKKNWFALWVTGK